MTINLSSIKTRYLILELCRRVRKFFEYSTYNANGYNRIAAQYGIDITDQSLVNRFFLEVVPSFPVEEQEFIELQLRL